jgi:glycosyltransferase involved in cell wall biosynthesis
VRIAYVCADPGIPVFGSKGASVHVRELCRALAELGHEVAVFTPRPDGPRPDGFAPEVVELEPDDGDEAAAVLLARDPACGAAAAREVRSLLYAAATRRRLAAALRDFGADIVYERYALLATSGAWAARALDVPHILEVNAPLSAEQAAHRGLAFAVPARALERRLIREADRVVAVSTALERWLAANGVDPGRIAVVPNAVDPERFAGARRPVAVDGAAVVGFVGTLKPWHDVASLIRAVALLSCAGMRLRLLVVGDGPERPALEALARAERLQASFVGSVAHDEVPGYVAAFDAAVVPYASAEDFYFSPLKLFECLAAGRPVVAADVGDVGCCIRHGRTGLLYPPGDVSDLAHGLLALLVDPVRAAALAAAGRAHVRGHHTWARNAAAVVALARAARGERRGVAA